LAGSVENSRFAHNTDFNPKRELFCRGNRSRLFQQDRPVAALSEEHWSDGIRVGHHKLIHAENLLM